MSTDIQDGDFSTLYVELDCLLDTPFATLFRMGEEVATKVIDLGWHDRVTEFLPGVDYTEYQRMYAARDKRTLKNAMVTPILNLIADFAKSTLENSGNSPYQYKPKLVLNFYPYVLDEEETKMILGIVYKKIGESMPIDVINKPPEEITPYYVKSLFSVMVMYRYDLWIEMHAVNKKWEKTTCPEVTLLAPALDFKFKEKLPEDYKEAFVDMQNTASPLINLNLLPADVFSMVARVKKKPAQP